MFCAECKPDRLLISLLIGESERQVVHQGNRPEVLRWLTRNHECTGMIDEDPDSYQSPYIRELAIENDEIALGIKLLVDRNRSNRVVVICPRLEDWILRAAARAGVDVTRRPYGLPSDGHQLNEIINYRLPGFRRLVEQLQLNQSDLLRKLQQFLLNKPI